MIPEMLLNDRVTLYHGDMRHVLHVMGSHICGPVDPRFDSCVTDPPYHLQSIVDRFGAPGSAPATGAFKRLSDRFGGKQWDGGEVARDPETWRRVLAVLKPGAYLVAFSHPKTYHRMACAIEDSGFDIRDMAEWLFGSGFPRAIIIALEFEKRLCYHVEPARWFYHDDDTDMRRAPPFRSREAQAWADWATGLKPAHEPICIARKPLIEGATNVENVEAHGVGAFNIGGCRLGDKWPSNVLHDDSAEVISALGGAADLGVFYTAKANTDERAGSEHPTVKPLDLMQYLCRLVTPPGGHVLDPFAGTGTTGEAAWREGFRATLIELEAQSCEDIRRRCALALAGPEERSRAIVQARGKLETVDALPLFSPMASYPSER